MVNYEVTGMSVKDLYRRVRNGKISLESKYLTKATTSNASWSVGRRSVSDYCVTAREQWI